MKTKYELSNQIVSRKIEVITPQNMNTEFFYEYFEEINFGILYVLLNKNSILCQFSTIRLYLEAKLNWTIFYEGFWW